jgi:hypothetical protein
MHLICTEGSRRHMPTDSGIDETNLTKHLQLSDSLVKLPLVSSYCTLAIGCAKPLEPSNPISK